MQPNRKRLGYTLGGAAALLAAAVGVFFAIQVSLKPVLPSAVEGERWSDDFVALITGQPLLQADEAAARALLPGLGPAGTMGCQVTAQVRAPRAQIVTFQALALEGTSGPPCGPQRFQALQTVLRRSAGVTPAYFAQHLAALYGPPRTAQPGPHKITRAWQPLAGLRFELTEYPGGPNPDEFGLDVDHTVGTASAVPSKVEADRWMVGYVDLVTGPKLAGARGEAAAAIVGGLEPAADSDAQCLSYHVAVPGASPYIGNILMHVSGTGSGCLAARLDLLTGIWQSATVTPEAMHAVLAARFGAPHPGRSGPYVTEEWDPAPALHVQLNTATQGWPDQMFDLIVRQSGASD